MGEGLNVPTYEEYCKANDYARFRYKYSLYVLIACLILLGLLVFFVYHYATELSTHPAIYMMDSIQVHDCFCLGDGKDYYINRTAIKFLVRG